MRLVKKGKSIQFIIPAEIGISPGQRFRFEHYLSILEERGFKIKISPFYNITSWNSLYQKKQYLNKFLAVTNGMLRRVVDTFTSIKYDYIYIYREASPLGPPIFEWVLFKIFKKKIIYDFDDAIWVPQTSTYNKNILHLKWYSKIKLICSWSYRVSVGNDFLKEYAEKYAKSVRVIPTVVDTKKKHNQLQRHDATIPAVGWTGTFSTLKYLEIILPAIVNLQKKYEFNFFVIADVDPKPNLKNYTFIKWNKETEISDILRFHIGVMPLINDDISRGKCGFKAIQYMSLGIPAVVSPIGVNSTIIENGVNGYLCHNIEDWIKSIEILLVDSQLRETIGIQARIQIETLYSVEATTEQFINQFS